MSNANEPKETRHAATDPEKCYEMEQKYGWRLIDVEATGNEILEVDCVFEGDVRFPDYLEEKD